ncbi:nucleotide exchange factor GrpE [Bacteroidales bacterium OttesenSCG-928-C03]|nr:nucleotide exchange factor GrpE [Bacteroidales bacterium OttesenSCG-928-E04]MDL2309129.1 nucleotide exchange factor GrpE [Bacteroidales bacterium OttesenSCG-928-C03]MDL2325967.1 nucleotide exchange factor GrpE [Bacteroidales bacterium OttesenSCG-928-A14]
METERNDQELNYDQLNNDLGQEDFSNAMENDGEEQCEEPQAKSGFWGKKSSGKEMKLKEDLEKLQLEKSELNDRFLRLYSEFENYKRRTQKERLELIDTASEKVILDILPVIDDFERAIEANEKLEDSSSMKEGFELIYHKLLQVLKKNGVEEIVAKGELFDTDFHEAITYIPAANENEVGRVVDVVQKGYKMQEKVIRFVKVVIAK